MIRSAPCRPWIEGGETVGGRPQQATLKDLRHRDAGLRRDGVHAQSGPLRQKRHVTRVQVGDQQGSVPVVRRVTRHAQLHDPGSGRLQFVLDHRASHRVHEAPMQLGPAVGLPRMVIHDTTLVERRPDQHLPAADRFGSSMKLAHRNFERTTSQPPAESRGLPDQGDHVSVLVTLLVPYTVDLDVGLVDVPPITW